MATKKEETPAEKPQVSQNDNSLPVLSMVFGIISFTGFGLIFGIPAIILGSMALKRNLPERGLALTGLITGIISTVLSVLFIILLVFLFIWGANYPGDMTPAPHPGRGAEQLFEGSRT